MKRISSVLISLGLIIALGVVSGCSGRNKDGLAFHGVVFKTRTKAVDKKVSRADFTAIIYNAARSLDGAREAARYEGTKYCITNYGTSEVDWSIGPETEPARLSVSDGAITFRGRCDP